VTARIGVGRSTAWIHPIQPAGGNENSRQPRTNVTEKQVRLKAPRYHEKGPEGKKELEADEALRTSSEFGARQNPADE
jgi:hypothetical protein